MDLLLLWPIWLDYKCWLFVNWLNLEASSVKYRPLYLGVIVCLDYDYLLEQ